MAAMSLSATIAASESTPGREKLSVCAASRSGSPLRMMPRGLSAARAAVWTAAQDRARSACSRRASCAAVPRPAMSATGSVPRSEAAFLPAAEQQRTERGALVAAPPRYEGTDALRGVDLVAGDAH